MRIQSILFKYRYRVFRNYEKLYIQSKRRIYRYQLSAIFMSYYSPAVHTVQNSQAYNHFREIGTILVYLVFNFFVDPDPEQQFRILIQAKVSNPCGCGPLFLST